MNINWGDILFQLGYAALLILVGIALFSFFATRKKQKRRIHLLEEKVAKYEKQLASTEK